ncbi:hypothetical protein M0R45_026275 [Rubus argutus]|uniref:Uncharacterized protein n=1 Tax=Rubus argutus TaxID=59490 RepID=A0AAW1WWI4_RUBAR
MKRLKLKISLFVLPVFLEEAIAVEIGNVFKIFQVLLVLVIDPCLVCSLLRHRTVHVRSTSVMHQEFLVLRMDSCMFYLLYGIVALVNPFQILPRGKEQDIVVVLVSQALGLPFGVPFYGSRVTS